MNEARDLVHAQRAVYRNNRPVLLAACASAIESPFTVFADPGKYEWYSRDQLAPQRKLWESKEKQLKLLMDKAKQSTGGSAISVVAYQGDYGAAREELQVIDATARAKKCKMPGDWQSDSVIRGATVAALDLGRVLINAQMSGFGGEAEILCSERRSWLARIGCSSINRLGASSSQVIVQPRSDVESYAERWEGKKYLSNHLGPPVEAPNFHGDRLAALAIHRGSRQRAWRSLRKSGDPKQSDFP